MKFSILYHLVAEEFVIRFQHLIFKFISKYTLFSCVQNIVHSSRYVELLGHSSPSTSKQQTSIYIQADYGHANCVSLCTFSFATMLTMIGPYNSCYSSWCLLYATWCVLEYINVWNFNMQWTMTCMKNRWMGPELIAKL